MITETVNYYEVNDVVNMHDKFINDKNEWTRYLSYNNVAKYSIGKFYKANIALFDYSNISKKNGKIDVIKLSKWSISLSKKYVEWYISNSKKTNISDEEKQNIAFWFQGAIGEWFFIKNFEGLTMIVMNSKTDKKKRIRLNKITPYYITNKKDYGIDFIAVNNDMNVVAGQIKFWNALSDKKIGYENVFAKLGNDAQGQLIRITNPKYDNNLVVMHLGDEDLSESLALKDLENYHQLILIGSKTITETLQNDFRLSWEAQLKELM